MSTSRHGYIGSKAEVDFERERQRLFAVRADPVSRRRLELLVRPGSVCLEIGAGAGSIAGWLADRVGPGGSVVATDLEPALLGPIASHGRIEGRQSNLMEEPPERGRYDLIHCRLVLMHVPDPALTLAQLVQGLRPGGWLCVEEGDFGAFCAVDQSRPDARRFGEAHEAICRSLYEHGAFDPYLGRRVAWLCRDLDLTSTGDDGATWVTRGGTPGSLYMARNIEMIADRLIAWGAIDDDDRQMFARCFADPSFEFIDATMFAAWGQRPLDGS